MLRHNSMPTGIITCDLSIAYVVENGERIVIPAALCFDPADPMAITLRMWVAEDQVVEWTFARELLADGARRFIGAGDVRVHPVSRGDRRLLALALSNPSGHADLELPAPTVESFVRRTYAAVPAVMESDLIDWDAELDSLLRPA